MADRVETTGIYHIPVLEARSRPLGFAEPCPLKAPGEDPLLPPAPGGCRPPGALGVPCPSSASASHRVYPAGLWPLSPLLITPPVIGGPQL